MIFFRNQGCTPMPSHTFPVLSHASAQPQRRHSKNIKGGLGRVLRRNNNKGAHMHTYIHTYITEHLAWL